MSTLFAGLDWASRTHAVCVIDERGAVRAQFEVTHDAAGLSELRRRLAAFGRDCRCHRAPLGPDRRCADRGRLHGRADPSQHRQGHPAALPQPRRQERRFGRVPAGRLAAHRRPPLQAAGPAQRRDPRAARSGARARRSGGHTRAAGQPTAQPARVVLARRGRGLRRRRLADRAGTSSSATPRPTAAARLGPKRMAAFCAQHHYSGRRSPEELLARLHQAAAVKPRCSWRCTPRASWR